MNGYIYIYNNIILYIYPLNSLELRFQMGMFHQEDLENVRVPILTLTSKPQKKPWGILEPMNGAFKSEPIWRSFIVIGSHGI